MTTAISTYGEGTSELAITDELNNELALCEGLAGGGGDFLPYIKLMQSTSPEVEADKAKRCDYFLKVGNEGVNLGKEFDCKLISLRPKAVEWRDGKPIICYDSALENGRPTGEYARIEQAAKDWDGPKSKNPFKTGPEFLLALRDVFDGETPVKYATLHLNTPSLKYQYRKIASFLGKHVTITGEKVEMPDYTFAGLEIRHNSAGFPIDTVEMTEVRTKFKEEKGTDMSTVVEETEDNGRD